MRKMVTQEVTEMGPKKGEVTAAGFLTVGEGSYTSRKGKHWKDTLVFHWNWSIITHGLRQRNRGLSMWVFTHVYLYFLALSTMRASKS